VQQLVTTSVTSQIDMFNWRFYLQWLSACALIPVIAVIIRQHLKINQISQIVAVLSSLPRTCSFELRRQEAVTTTTLADEKSEMTQDYSSWLVKQLVTEISGIETSFFTITAFLIIGIFIVIILLWRYAMGRHSYIFLEAISPVDFLQLRICKLPNATRNFALALGKISLQIQHLGCIGIAHINGNVALTNSLTRQPIQMPYTVHDN
jgi:hypothetical protein